MSIIELDSNLEDLQDFEPLPDGIYPAEIREVEVRTSEKIPQGYFYIQLRVDPEDYPADYDADNAPDGAVLTYAQVQLPDKNNRRSHTRLKRFYDAMGLKWAGASIDTEQWLNRRVGLHLKRDNYQGQPNNSVEAVVALGEA